jgi:outer membrane protein assembly factor BamB
MKRFAAIAVSCLGWALAVSGTAQAQSRDWMTDNGDAQRSAWVQTDAKISKESMQMPRQNQGFQFLWKLKVKNQAIQMNSITPPSTLERLIGYRGFRMLGFVGGSSDNIFTIDTDLGRMEWEKHLSSTAPAQAGTLSCPGGMTTSVVRPTIAAMSFRSSGSGRMTPAKSGVGEPKEGAVTLARVPPPPPRPATPPSATPPNAQPSVAPRPSPANPPGGQFGRGPFLIYALASDGRLHSMHLSNGTDFEPPVQFLPPNANAKGLIVLEQVAYVVTQQGCGGAANGLWALDLVTKQVRTWKADVAGLVGPAFGGDGTIYATTESGGEVPNSVVALDPKTLQVKGSFSAGSQEFSTTPVVFDYKGKTLLAATTRDGRVHLLEGANLATPLFTSPAVAKDFEPGALASWQEANGTRWVLAPVNGSLSADAGFRAPKGAPGKGAVVAWKIVEQNGKVILQPGWASRDLVSPLPPTIINGVAFVVSSGEYRTNNSKLSAAQRALRSSRAVVYALDATTGKELWNSGTTITSFTRGAALSGGMGQIYLGTHDGTIYAFGFPMEH